MPNSASLHVKDLSGQLAEYRQRMSENPQINPIQRLAHHLSRQLENGDISSDTLQNLTRELTLRAFLRRADDIRDYVGETNITINQQRLAELFNRLFDNMSDFSDTADLVSRELYGIVFTAHPTFSSTKMLREKLASTVINPSLADDPGFCEDIRKQDHGPVAKISLAMEANEVQAAIKNCQHSLATIYRALFVAAREKWPNRWHELCPRLITIASWVGYDLDGRTDIPWTTSFIWRLKEKKLQLERLVQRLNEITQQFSLNNIVMDHVQDLRVLLLEQTSILSRQISLFSEAIDEPAALALAANSLTGHDTPLTSTAPVARMLGACILLADDVNLAVEFAILRAEANNYGLGPSHIHLRLNAAQLHNAVRSDLAFYSAPDQDGQRRKMIAAINDLIGKTSPVGINFSSIHYEQTTAKRSFMMMAQILKHVDSETPIRFLIAETETPFTMLAALYLARQFDIADKVDLSPLFETGIALARGSDIIAELLNSPHYLDYIKGRGRLCIQTGFSDAGRFLGQAAASLAIERLHIKLAALLEQRGLQDIEVVIFNTHGESIGRGAHPGSMTKRMQYVFSDQARMSFCDAGISVKHETSFQGGDGYLFFENQALSLATTTCLLENHLRQPDGQTDIPDLLYEDSDHSLEFFLRLKTWFEQVVDNDDYAALLGMFHTRMLPVTGSRKSLRQHDGVSSIAKSHPSQMRAIPNNALLQQMGYLVNSLSGIGQSVNMDPENFHSLHNGSPRLQTILEMIAIGRRRSSMLAMSAYCDLFDAGYWLSRAYADAEPALQENFVRLSELVEHTGIYPGVSRITRHFQQDAIDLNRVLAGLGYEGRSRDDAAPVEIDILHALRLALIMHLWLKAMKVPDFSPRNDVTTSNLQTMVLALDVEHALPLLREAFPCHKTRVHTERYIEKADNVQQTQTGYDQLHEEVFGPVAQTYQHLLHIGSAITLHHGAHG